MAEIINMPRLSDTMTEGTVATWLKKIGDTIKEGDILAEIETDKATMEFESFNAGTLLYVGIQEGQSAPVDSVLAIIGPAGTDVSGIAENYTKAGEAPTTAKSETKSVLVPITEFPVIVTVPVILIFEKIDDEVPRTDSYTSLNVLFENSKIVFDARVLIGT